MNTWNNPNFPARDKPTSNHCQTPKDAVCCNCGWMFSDHKKNVIQEVWFCPDAPTMPGYPRLQKWSWATEQQQYLSEIQELKRQVSEVSKWNMDLQKQRNESDFLIKNLKIQLNERINVESTGKCKQSHSAHVIPQELCNKYYDLLSDRDEWERQNTDCRMALENKTQQVKKLQDQLQKAMCDETCYPTRLGLEDQIRELRNKFRCPDGMFCGICKTCAYENAVNEIKQLKKQLSEAQKHDTYASYELEKKGREELLKRCDQFRIKCDELNSVVNDWKYKFWEKEREILVVRDELDQKQKEVDDIAKSKTISVHNYYQSPAKWEPIETAPKDGSYILVASSHPKCHEIVTGHWVNGHWVAPYGAHLVNITHWMPLPQAPQ